MYNYPISADIDELQIVVEYKYVVRNSVLQLFWSSVHRIEEKKTYFPISHSIRRK